MDGRVESEDGAVRAGELDRVLTDGYAAVLELQADQLALQRRIDVAAEELMHDEADGRVLAGLLRRQRALVREEALLRSRLDLIRRSAA